MKYPFILLIVMGLLVSSHTTHPLKMSVADITQADKTLNLKIKLFTDDLESTLQQFSKQPLDLVNKGVTPTSEKWIKQYIAAKFSMDINGVPVKWIYKKAYTLKEKEGVVFVEYQAKLEKIASLKSVKLKNILLFDGIPEQKNIVNIQLMNSSRMVQFENEKEEAVKTIEF